VGGIFFFFPFLFEYRIMIAFDDQDEDGHAFLSLSV
jgi:hypothetical protein